MNCNCFKRQPCPIHKDKPLPKVDEFEDTMYVVRIHGKWVNDVLHYYSTVAQNAIQIYKSDIWSLKDSATKQACMFITKS